MRRHNGWKPWAARRNMADAADGRIRPGHTTEIAVGRGAAAVPSILVVDDDPRVRDWFKRVLSSAGYRVALASTFNVAQRALHSDPPDLLIVGARRTKRPGLARCA
jgi:PleD family two-component response regulator